MRLMLWLTSIYFGLQTQAVWSRDSPKRRGLLSIWQECSSQFYEESVVRLVVECKQQLEITLAKLAQHIWRDVCGRARAAGSRKLRSDVGFGRHLAEHEIKHSYRAFWAQHRPVANVAAVSISRAEADQEISELASATWSDSHAKEETHAKTKTRNWMAQASREGALLPHEDSAALHAEGDAVLNKMAAEQQKRERLHAGRLARNLGGLSSPSSASPLQFLKPADVRGKSNLIGRMQ